MRKVTFTEAILNPVKAFEAAANGPILITRRNRCAAVILSVDEYERLTKLNVAEPVPARPRRRLIPR
ncbi:MAG: hypothetical protein CVV05_00805 [Gammaproteobacteria bacterium HGW-Gammaproteobacteria-1]|jgi:PHD/YefM family antitoxin component YafN of YafNO toxin-antitoxin module|nr:MAG: hypothetical protein CVV05_00805 [Gammaproteobacteria bacterium HGW-Gammaproteobacteria-1]